MKHKATGGDMICSFRTDEEYSYDQTDSRIRGNEHRGRPAGGPGGTACIRATDAAAAGQQTSRKQNRGGQNLHAPENALGRTGSSRYLAPQSPDQYAVPAPA